MTNTPTTGEQVTTRAKSASDPILMVHGLSFAYEGGTLVFNGVNFDLEAGHSFTILGPTIAARHEFERHREAHRFRAAKPCGSLRVPRRGLRRNGSRTLHFAFLHAL